MLILKANIVRRKYKSIYCKLKQRSVTYASSLKELEDDIKEHENEMKRLRVSSYLKINENLTKYHIVCSKLINRCIQLVKEEAIELRYNLQEKLVKQEIEIVNNSNEQDSIIQDYRFV